MIIWLHKHFKEKKSKVNSEVDKIAHQNIADINTLLLAGENVVADMMGNRKELRNNNRHLDGRDLRKDLS